MIEIKVDDNTYTEEEFQRDLKRYFKELGTAIPDRPCQTFEDCKRCMFFKNNLCGKTFVNAKPIRNSFEIIEKVYNWSKEHPVMTNRRKLKEVFGINVINSIIVDCEKNVSSDAYSFSNIKGKDISLSPISQYDGAFGDWLDEEYKEPVKKDE